ncbi:AMP-dependent synthetase [Pseudomonas sp. FW215-R2]|uniref:phenylacetate--CoA ligase family protein n=1 Tax=unclassified Pseudomonas TaxID=196821 RepID=UPI000C88ED50|nr:MULTISPECIES: AMP-dependent synthetase [unclassified Pseudomonas]PMW97524.1 AMP-dependent synthetase [Pseudomonas sp. FW215-R2]PMX08212.1 AMP-dependent synthetase [Pseudomonas sp. FW215-L1]PMX21379.1 AMP-dependent synthetase [Pseudomonas sp. FW215-E1]PNA28513.1 AMP-dependent synthetase [Pseudomonas sp. FW215-R4]
MIPRIELQELVAFARQHSSFYASHFASVPEQVTALTDLPVIDPAHYWKGSQDLDRWPVLTASLGNALVFKTGGTTSDGKLSVFERREWQTLVEDFGRSLTGQLNKGDRVANLFFVGDLYASFIFTHDVLAHVEPGVVEFPFTGHVESTVLADSISRHRINVLAGLPAHLLTFAAWLEHQGRRLECIECLLYGGESLFPAQLQLLGRVFPNVRVASMGYASVDAGFIGASHRDCALGEHRMAQGHSVLEILDEQTGEVIEECDRTGRLVMTNLTRRLMPLIRYPVGDRACWRELERTPTRKFALMGRSADSQRVRVGILTLLPDEIGDTVQRLTGSDDWQLVIEQAGTKDILRLKWAPDAVQPASADTDRRLHHALIEHYPLIEQLNADHLLDVEIHCCTVQDLSRHPRSGKRQRVLDLRVYDSPPMEHR